MAEETGRSSTQEGDLSPSAVDRSVRVLVVDDETDVAEVTAGFLERSSAELSVAVETDPRTALKRLDDERFDCVVSDHEMPGMDGIEFLEAVRETSPGLPFVLLTGKGDEDIASRAITAGVSDYVRKRNSTDHYELLARRVLSAVEQRRAEHELSELDRINQTIRETTGRVVRAETRAEIERAVCETLADAESYCFAWIGVIESEEVVPATWAGIERGYLDDITITTDRSPTGQGPAGRAARTGEPQTTEDVSEDPDFEPWREAAEQRGYESSASIPLVYDDTRYGLLNVYADRPAAFDERELDVLAELGDTVAHAIHRVELTDRVVDQYETLFEESPVIAVTTRDEDGEPVIENCNRRFLERLGYDRSAVVDRPLAEFYTAESTRKLLEKGGYDRALTDEFTREERTLVTADGEAVETLLRAVPREGRNGETVGTFALYVDFSERRRLERENERLDEFASVVSHDLRSPLTVIRGHAELASEQYDSEDIDAIVDAAERMESLVEDLLEAARQGKAVEETEPVRLAETVRNCRRTVETDGVSLRVETDAVVRADESRLKQLLENLLRNAIDHGSTSPASDSRQDAVEHGSTSSRPKADDAGSEDASEPSVADAPDDAAEYGRATEDDELEITVGDLDGADGFYVEDDGVGVPPDERSQVFEAGYSGDEDSTGFGLSIVGEIAEVHGWDISLTESATGGARFEITGVERV